MRVKLVFVSYDLRDFTMKEELKHSSAVFAGRVVEIVDENKNKSIQSSADPIAVL